MANPKLAQHLLHDLEIAVLERIAPESYELLQPSPAFYDQLFPAGAIGQPCGAPWHYSPMLEFFLSEAEIFFSQQQYHEKIDSGIWLETTEDHREIPLLAHARYVGSTPVITIQCVKEYYEERVRILQQARSELLEMDRLNSALLTYKKKSLYDALTNLYNRSAFEDFLAVQMSNRRNAGKGFLSLLMLDIDYFKSVNDTYGHLVGDSVLVAMGVIFNQSLRRRDIAARFGGEEFVVLTPHTNLQQAAIVAEKLRRNVQDYSFGLEIPVTISIGVTMYQHGESQQRFIKRADDALYQAKQGGRNQVCVL